MGTILDTLGCGVDKFLIAPIANKISIDAQFDILPFETIQAIKIYDIKVIFINFLSIINIYVVIACILGYWSVVVSFLFLCTTVAVRFVLWRNVPNNNELKKYFSNNTDFHQNILFIFKRNISCNFFGIRKDTTPISS